MFYFHFNVFSLSVKLGVKVGKDIGKKNSMHGWSNHVLKSNCMTNMFSGCILIYKLDLDDLHVDIVVMYKYVCYKDCCKMCLMDLLLISKLILSQLNIPTTE